MPEGLRVIVGKSYLIVTSMFMVGFCSLSLAQTEGWMDGQQSPDFTANVFFQGTFLGDTNWVDATLSDTFPDEDIVIVSLVCKLSDCLALTQPGSEFATLADATTGFGVRAFTIFVYEADTPGTAPTTQEIQAEFLEVSANIPIYFGPALVNPNGITEDIFTERSVTEDNTVLIFDRNFILRPDIDSVPLIDTEPEPEPEPIGLTCAGPKNADGTCHVIQDNFGFGVGDTAADFSALFLAGEAQTETNVNWFQEAGEYDVYITSACAMWCGPCQQFASDSGSMTDDLAAEGINAGFYDLIFNDPNVLLPDRQDAVAWLDTLWTADPDNVWYGGEIGDGSSLDDVIGRMAIDNDKTSFGVPFILIMDRNFKILHLLEGYSVETIKGLVRDAATAEPLCPSMRLNSASQCVDDGDFILELIPSILGTLKSKKD